MKRAYIAESLIDARLVSDMLDASGIPCILVNQNAMGGFGELPVTYPEVWVKRDRDLQKARRAINDFEKRPPPDDTVCAICGEGNPATFDVCWCCDAVL